MNGAEIMGPLAFIGAILLFLFIILGQSVQQGPDEKTPQEGQKPRTDETAEGRETDEYEPDHTLAEVDPHSPQTIPGVDPQRVNGTTLYINVGDDTE